MEEKPDLDALAAEFAKLARITALFVGGFLAIFAGLAGPAFVEAGRKLPEILESAKHAPQPAVYSAAGAVVAALLGVLAAVSGPVLMFLVARFLRARTHYGFCKRAVTFLSFYRPTRPLLIERTLNLLETEPVRASFR